MEHQQIREAMARWYTVWGTQAVKRVVSQMEQDKACEGAFPSEKKVEELETDDCEAFPLHPLPLQRHNAYHRND